MKKLIVTASFLMIATISNAQVITPKSSPKAEVEQMVGLTEVDVNYARPAKKGRLVYGDLVPFGKIWRTGANENTTVEFSDDVIVGGQKVPKGKYALYTLPKADTWEVYLYSDTSNWGLPAAWDDSKVVAKTTANPVALANNVENFTIEIDQIDNNTGEIVLKWEKTAIPVKFTVPTHEKAMASIKSTLNENAKASDYYAAGQYLFQATDDTKLALDYINKSIDMQGGNAPFYMLRQKSLVQAKLGDKKGAIETAKKSLAEAEKANNADYIKMNRDSINQWSK
ncbi:DUF2911 domain-containing protein [Flavobacterium sp. I3-2]|uniref:DUF2911 domain-containing protein n=1 Tax=Flavobacterium sp. I3-2 TaxID=2748319 RepID=UPI0015AE67F2|nr:DUF2911 domain-containing protein [Flavobacterium sp. I3-2]